jgi:uncharacterized membrane protein
MSETSPSEHLAFERLLFFSDAVFAIAITLLVIEIKVPELPHGSSDRELGFALLRLIPRIVGFVVSFFLIGQTWVEHHRIGRQLRHFDLGLLWKNLLLLFFVAFMPFSTGVLSEFFHSPVAVCLYATTFAGMGLAKASFWRHAVARQLVPASEETSRIGHRIWSTPITAAGVAIAAGLGVPNAIMGLLLLPLIAWLLDRRGRKAAVSAAA